MNTAIEMNIFVLITVIVLYLGVIAFLSYLGLRKTNSKEDFVSGGRNIPPYIMALSYGAAFVSTSAIVGFGGAAANLGLSLLWLTVCTVFFGIFLAFAVLGKRTRKIGLTLDTHTFAELLSKRVGSKFIQVFTGSVLFLTMPLYAAAVLIGASRIIESLLGVPYVYAVAVFSILIATYVLVGGLRGVMYTDALQGTLMILGMVVLLIVTFVKVGGPIDGMTKLTEMSHLVPEKLQQLGHTGWTSSPKINSPLWWIIYSSLVLGVGIGVLAQPHLAVRSMTVKSNRELNRAVLIGSIFTMICVGTPFIVGALSNVFFYETSGQIAIQATGGNSDNIIPLFIRQAMPTWFGYLFMLVLLSAAISTLSSQFHAIGIAIGRDVYEKVSSKHKSKISTVLISRIGIVLAIIFTVFLALKLSPGIIARATAIFFGIIASGYLAPFIVSLYWKRLTRIGMISGIMSGLSAVAFGYLFLHKSESSVLFICKFLTGKASLLSGVGMWDFIDPLVYSIPISLFFTIIVSLLTKVENKEVVKKLF